MVGLLVATEQNKLGTVWQPIPILCHSVWFICSIGLVGMVMMRAHRDRRPNVVKWYFLNVLGNALTFVGECTPYPLIGALGQVLYWSTSILGIYVLVMKIDKDAEQQDVKNGYRLLVAYGVAAVPTATLAITSTYFSSAFGAFFVSGALMIFHMVVLKIMIPMFKKCFGDDERKLWSYAVPAVILALELGPCLLLLGSNMKTLEFWGLLLFQELNSVLKNTGIYTKRYVAVRALLRRPVDEATLRLVEERRSTIAPCDNIGEVVSPVVILIAIGLEAAFDWSFERAPYFADRGILGGWRQQRFRGEAPLMLTIVLFVRVVFCWIEMKVRDRQRPNETATSATTNAGQRAPQTDEDASSEISRSNGSRARRSSMAVLYHRIARSDDRDAPIHMQCMAGALFALQPALFVFAAAYVGRVR